MPGSGDELAEGDRESVGAVGDREQEALVTGVEDAPKGHREAPFDLAPAAFGHDGPDRVLQVSSMWAGSWNEIV